MSAPRTLRDRARELVLGNFWLKAFSLACAIGFWVYIHGAETVQHPIDIEVIRLPAPPDRYLLTDVPSKVTLLLRGPKTQVDELKPDDVGRLQIDLRSGRDSRIDLDPSSLHIPAGVTVEQMLPSSVELRWDDIVTKEVPVQVSRVGEPAPGYEIKGVVLVNPPVIRVVGPRSMLNVMHVVRAAPFDVAGLTEAVHNRELALDRPPTGISYGNRVESVLATIDIARAIVSRDFPKLKVNVVGLLRATVQPTSVLVKIKGTAEDVRRVEPENLLPRVEPKTEGLDITKPGNAYLDVRVDVPNVAVEVVPAKVYVQW